MSDFASSFLDQLDRPVCLGTFRRSDGIGQLGDIGKSLLFGSAAAIAHNCHLAAGLSVPKIYPGPIRRTSPELTLQELVNDSSTKIGRFRAVFRVFENGKATEPKGCRGLKCKLAR